MGLIGVAIAGAAVNNVAEEVVWVVGDQPIWKSDVEETYQSMLYEKMPVNGDPYCVIPERIAIEKLYLHQADIDTVIAPESWVQQQLEAQLNYYVNQLGSKEKVEQIFNKPYNTLREGMRETVANRYRIQQVQRSLTKGITTTPAEVRRYFEKLPADSVPFVPLQVEVQILTAAPSIPQEEIDNVKARLRDYSDRVTKGESEFSTLAILYSEDLGTAQRGGEVGLMGRGQLVPEFAAVAFNLNDPKKVSKIVKTEYGYHIMQLIEKRGERVNVRHILLRPRVSDKDLVDAVTRLDSVRSEMQAGKFTFEEAATVLSMDKDTRNNRGVMVNPQTGTARFEMSDLPQEVAKEVTKLEPGEVSRAFIMKDPKTNLDIVAIAKLTRRIPGHKANLAEDYQQIKGMYQRAREQEILKNWLEKKIADTYVRVEEGWRNCDFEHKGWLKTHNK